MSCSMAICIHSASVFVWKTRLDLEARSVVLAAREVDDEVAAVLADEILTRPTAVHQCSQNLASIAQNRTYLPSAVS